MTTQKLIPLKKKIETLANEALALNITTPHEMQIATVILSNINKYVDSVQEQKDLLIKPINVSIKNIRTMFKPLEEIYEQAITDIRAKMTLYQTQAVLEARRVEEVIANRVKAGTGNLSIEKAVEKISKIERPEKEVATESGLVQFAEVKCFEVTDISKLPIAYHLPDEVAIRKAMKDGREIDGVRYWTEQQPRNYR